MTRDSKTIQKGRESQRRVKANSLDGGDNERFRFGVVNVNVNGGNRILYKYQSREFFHGPPVYTHKRDFSFFSLW